MLSTFVSAETIFNALHQCRQTRLVGVATSMQGNDVFRFRHEPDKSPPSQLARGPQRIRIRREAPSVVPFSAAEQTKPEMSVKLKLPLDGKDTWAVCSHPATVSTHRFLPDGERGVAHVPNDDFQRIKKKVLANFPD